MYTVYTENTRRYEVGDFHPTIFLFENLEEAEEYAQGLYLKQNDLVVIAKLNTKKEYILVRKEL